MISPYTTFDNSSRARGPPVDYGDKPAAAKRSLLTPPRWSLFAPPLTPAGAVLVVQIVLIVSEDAETAFAAICFAVA